MEQFTFDGLLKCTVITSSIQCLFTLILLFVSYTLRICPSSGYSLSIVRNCLISGGCIIPEYSISSSESESLSSSISARVHSICKIIKFNLSLLESNLLVRFILQKFDLLTFFAINIRLLQNFTFE